MQNPIKDPETVSLLDISAVLTTVGTIASILPPLAAIFTIIWTAIRIYETKSVQKWLNK